MRSRTAAKTPKGLPTVKPIPEALAEFAQAVGLKITRAQFEVEGGTFLRVQLSDKETTPGSPWSFTEISATYRGKELPLVGVRLKLVRALSEVKRLAKAQLIQKAWGDGGTEEKNLRTTVSQVNKILIHELRPDRIPIKSRNGYYYLTLD